MTDHPVPSEAEVLGYFESVSNWGRWGPDDSAGTINLITPEKRREGAALVRTGRAVSIAHPLNTVGQPGNWNPAQHFMRFNPNSSGDYIGVYFHGYAHTHIDALCHIFWQGKMWNGKDPAKEVTPAGALSGGIDALSQGITTRGVLVDIPRFRGTPHVTLDAPVCGWEIEAATEAQGTPLRPGDALLVFSGRKAFYEGNPGAVPGIPPAPGLHADCVPVLRRNDVALLGWDMLDANPSGYEVFANAFLDIPVHVFAITYMGLPLLDNANLDPLAAACAEENRWEFMFTLNPLHVRGGTGSPVNPIATF
ncbi:MAG: cyclase family protein [Tepidiformaceae bacterium]